MVDADALVVGLSSILAVGVYIYLGVRVARRPVSPGLRFPASQFALFWIGLGISTALGAFESLWAAFAIPPQAIVVTFSLYDVLLVCAALWGLICYLAFLYSGRSWILPISALYVLEYGLIVYVYAAGQPSGVSVNHGVVGVVYASTPNLTVEVVAVLLLVLPEIIAALAYFTLFFRTQDPVLRRRIAIVSWGILGWFILEFINVGNLLGGGPLAILIGQLVLVGVVLVILSAYLPPLRAPTVETPAVP